MHMQVTTFTTEGSNAAAAAMVFCAVDGSSLESDSDLRRHSVVLLRAGSKQDQINVLSALLCKAEWEGLHAGLPRHMIGPVPQKERPRPPVLFSSIVGEEEHDSVGINRDLTGLNYISGLDFFVLRSVCATAEDCMLQYVRDANALSSLYTTGMQYMLHAWLARDNTNCTMAPEVIRAGSHQPPTQPPRAAPRMGLGLSLRLVAAQAQLQDPSAAIPIRPPPTSAGTSQTLRPPAGSRPYTAGRGQPAIGGRGQPQLGAGNSRGPSPTGGRGKGDPAGSQGNRSSRGSSGSISDFDELAITAGIIPSLKAPAPSKAPANDPKHPQVHETSGQNPPGNEVVKGKVWGDSLARKLAASSHAPLVAPDSAERSAQRLCRGLEGPIGNHGLAGGSRPGEKTVEDQSTGSAPPVNGITNPVAPYSAERLAYRPNRGLERPASSRNLGQRLLEATGTSPHSEDMNPEDANMEGLEEHEVRQEATPVKARDWRYSTEHLSKPTCRPGHPRKERLEEAEAGTGWEENARDDGKALDWTVPWTAYPPKTDREEFEWDLANRFHLSTHGANSSHPFTVNHFNSTLHVYCTYEVAANRNRTENTPGTVDPLSAARAVYLAWLLLAAGDVEANPGPINEHYQQARHSSACQIYSLNNAAGHEWVTMHDIDHFYDNRLLQLTDYSERGAWLMARGAGGYSDEVIEMYLRVHYGLAVQSIAQLNQPNDWTANNLGNLACQYGTHTFLCRRPGHSMAMTCKGGTWHLLDSMKSTPTPISRIPAAAKRTMHQLFVITPNTRSREQIRLCEEKGIHNIISHAEHTSTHNRNTTAVEPTPYKVTAQNLAHPYMERQYEECCLVHAFNMAMGKKCIDYHAVINHCKQLAEHLQHLAQEARAAGHTIQTFKTDHIYHAKGKFSSDTLNHYLHRKQHEMHMYLHPASTYLPTQSFTPETITNAITSTGSTHTEAVILLSHQHATAIKHTQQGWHQLDSFNWVPKPLSTSDDWSSLQGNILTICTGDVRHTRFIRREIWIADPLEATTPTALVAHFRDHLDPIDLTTDHTEARETPGPLHVTTTTAETSCTTDSKRRATAEGTPPHDEPTRLRQRRDTPTVTLRPQTTTRIHRPTTPLDTATDAAKKRVRVTKRHGNDTHTQTLMFKYLCKPTAKTHNTGPVSAIDEAPKSTPDIDLGRNQHHSPPPPPTPNRQHITLTTFNVRGLHRSRNEVLNLVHSQSPDILILTETMTQPRSNNPSSGWLKRVMPNYTVHRHQGHSEVLIGIRHDLAIQMQATMIQPCTDADVNTRCVILSLRQRQSEELTLVATYWPSGNNDDALPLRKKMQDYIRTATGHLPGSLILAGDINATMKTEDRSEHTEYTQDTMMREFATEMRLSEADSGDRAWTYQQPHCNSRIDAILTRDARHGPEHRTHVDTNAYLSDHRPLTATLSTARLGIDLAAPQKPQKHSHTILTTPITNKDREAYRLAVQQPSSGAPQLHAHLTTYLAPMYTDAIHFLTTIDKANPQQPQRLTLVAGLPAREAVDTAATMLTTLLQTCRTTAIKTCNTKTLTRGGQHYQRRTMCRIRQALGKKLKTTRELSRKARVFFKQNNVYPTIDELIPETDTTNAETREAVKARQGDDTTENHVQAALAQLTISYRDQIHKLDDDDSALAIAKARVRMQQLISTQPKKANKYILRPSRTDHKGLQALADPTTNKICTAPADLNRIITEAYRQKLTPPTPKICNYTNTQTRNYPWARAKADDPFTMHTCQNVHWLHTAIMDKAGFQECLSRMSGGKAPGPDGIETLTINKDRSRLDRP
ncbi:hypothetical protein QJQ45_020715 [Haematococcus lacustris]|nr:hypothetical protein QJQ45_020715 [Haematococcus lacustris]